MYQYVFVTVACDAGNYIIADEKGGSYYVPKQFLSRLNASKLAMGDILHVTAEKALEMTELAGTNTIICHSAVNVQKKGSLLTEGKTADFLVCHTAYGSVLLNDLRNGRDYVIFTSYVTEGYRTPHAAWSAVTEGNVVKFLLFENTPVMPAPKKRLNLHLNRKRKKTPAMRSFLNQRYGASNGASII